MANEFERINNPDSTPGAVSTGYQLQNTNLVAQRVGLDCSVVLGGTGQCTLEVSGPVDVNGEIYTCNAQVIFTLTTAGKYYIHLAGSGANLTPTIGTGANTFDADKNARYTDTGTYRVLNWVIYYDGTTAFAHRLVNPVNDRNDFDDGNSFEEFWITSNGVWVAKRTKYYTIYVTGCGGSGGSGGAGGRYESYPTTGTLGGYAGSTGIKRILITAGTTWTATFTTGASSTTFTDGASPIVAGNQSGGVTGADIAFIGAGYGYGGNGGLYSTDGSNILASPGHHGSNGGASFWGSGGGGGAGGAINGNGSSGGAAQSFGGGGGSGGGGGGNVDGGTSSGGSGGAGKAGVIRIVG